MEENNENRQLQRPNIPPRSENSNKKAHVCFVNLTNRTVEVVWINFTGQYIRYQLLRRGNSINIDTFETHPWIAWDVHTKDRMLIGGQFFYFPKTYLCLQENPNLIRPIVSVARKIVCITLPLYSLRYLALLASRNLFQDPEMVDELEIPASLGDDLKRAIKLRNKNRSESVITVFNW